MVNQLMQYMRFDPLPGKKVSPFRIYKGRVEKDPSEEAALEMDRQQQLAVRSVIGEHRPKQD